MHAYIQTRVYTDKRTYRYTNNVQYLTFINSLTMDVWVYLVKVLEGGGLKEGGEREGNTSFKKVIQMQVDTYI